MLELDGHPFFLGTLFLPQARSTPAEPHPVPEGIRGRGRSRPTRLAASLDGDAGGPAAESEEGHECDQTDGGRRSIGGDVTGSFGEAAADGATDDVPGRPGEVHEREAEPVADPHRLPAV